VVARAPEPAPIPAPAPPAAAAPAPPPAPAPADAPPAPPVTAARPPQPAPGAGAPARPAPAAPVEAPSTSIWAGRQFSLLTPGLEKPALPPSGRGGTQEEGTGAGESGATTDGQIAVPLNTPDPRYADYFAELKRRIEDKWTYPSEASRKGQSGGGEIRFVLHKNGVVRTVQIVHSSGVPILDSYIENAIRMAQPFPPIPATVGDDVIPISISFNYILGGIRAFGLR
jgi:TonB family protein